jgi:hypothetical protein
VLKHKKACWTDAHWHLHTAYLEPPFLLATVAVTFDLLGRNLTTTWVRACACVRVRLRAYWQRPCARVCVRACVYVRACERARVGVCDHARAHVVGGWVRARASVIVGVCV